MPDKYGTFGSYLADALDSNRQFARQYADDQALKAYSTNPNDPAAIAALTARNPGILAQLTNARTGAQNAQLQADAAKRDLYQNQLVSWAQGGQTGPRPIDPFAAPVATQPAPQGGGSPTSIVATTIARPGGGVIPAAGQPVAPSAPAAPDEIVVNANQPKLSNEQVAGLLDAKHAQGYLQTKKMFGELDEQGQKQLVAQAGAIDALRPQMAKMSHEERLNYIEDNRAMLNQAGWTDAQINSYDPTDDNLAAIHHQALGAKDAQKEFETGRAFNETVRSHRVSEAQGQQRIGLEGQRIALQRKNDAGSAGLDPTTLDYAATIYRTTGQVPAVGYGAAGSGARRAIIQRAAQMAQSEGGGAAGDIANQVDFGGKKAAARTMGNTSAKVDYGVNELTASIPLARAASVAVPRSNFVPLNRLNQIIARGGGSAEQRDFAVKTQAVKNAYNLTAARAGTSVEERAHNNQLLDTADSPRAYAAALAAMAQEASVAKAASRKTMGEISGSGGDKWAGWKLDRGK